MHLQHDYRSQTETRLGCCVLWLHDSSICPLLSGHWSAGISSCKVEQRLGRGRCGVGRRGRQGRRASARTAAPCVQGEALLAAAPRSPHFRRHMSPAALIHTEACRLGEIHLQLQVTRAVAARPCPCAHTHSGARSSTGASYGRAPVPDGAPSRPRARV